MDIQFEERPYAGKAARPRPEIYLDPQSKTLIIATPWGSRTAAKKVINKMTDYLALAREDREATTPFPRLSCLSTQANNLRVAALLANESLYRDDNRQEYRSGVEIFAGILDEDEFVWLQAGNPQILLGRLGRGFVPLGGQLDLSFDLSEGGELLPALPAQLLGLDSSLNMTINSFRARSGDRIALLAHPYLPPSIFALPASEVSLDSMSRTIAQSDPDLAFWLGLLKIEDIAVVKEEAS